MKSNAFYSFRNVEVFNEQHLVLSIKLTIWLIAVLVRKSIFRTGKLSSATVKNRHTLSPRVFWQITNICHSLSQCEGVTQTCRPWCSKRQKERERQRRQRRGVFILRQQLKWVIIALKFHSDWAPLTCHCESSHKENGIFRESCTLTLVNWSGGSECCDRD